MRWLLPLLLSACTYPVAVLDTLHTAETTIGEAQAVHARICAPEELANAEALAEFGRLELEQGDAHRAGAHADSSLAWAREALEKARPCGSADRDEDGIADILDQCADEPEDLDGVDDEDGCRDIDPSGDEDGDGIHNIDDDCVFEPEDVDGHNDEDGCPETSEDSDGDGIIDAIDQCPVQAEDLDDFNDEDGCPDPDNDRDTVADTADACVMVPEDLDGFDDEDGCPDRDNDGDGLVDAEDRCPMEPGPIDLQGCPALDADGDGISDANDRCPEEPESVNDYLDTDGCPDSPPSRVRVTRKRIEITEQVLFETGRATIRPDSDALLDDIRKVLVDVPSMRIRIEGHTDSEGGDESNQRLSEERAASVEAWLVAHGVDPDRMESLGYGETRPIDTNRTASGRQANRRVEFHILQ